VERRFSGLQVQHVHMQLGRKKHRWPTIVLARDRGYVTAEGDERDIAIAGWCRSVWDPYTENRDTIIDLLSSTASFEQRAPAGGDLTVAWSCTF
jgi:hypothetical protein